MKMSVKLYLGLIFSIQLVFLNGALASGYLKLTRDNFLAFEDTKAEENCEHTPFEDIYNRGSWLAKQSWVLKLDGNITLTFPVYNRNYASCEMAKVFLQDEMNAVGDLLFKVQTGHIERKIVTVNGRQSVQCNRTELMVRTNDQKEVIHSSKLDQPIACP